MTNQTEIITYGGVKLEKNSIAKMNTSVTKDYYEREYKFFNVEFKNGIKIAYPQQEHPGSSVMTSQESWGDTKTNIYCVMGLELKGTKQRDDIKVKGGEIQSIDISGDGGGDSVEVERVTGPEVLGESYKSDLNGIWGNGEIVVDSNDNTTIQNFGSDQATKEGKFGWLHFGNGKKYHGVHRFEK